MAERRMFAKSIVDSDAFLEMPVTARLLYYDLGMRADDDGFVNAPKKIMKIVGATNDDMNILIMRKFVIPFESGIVVIKHWRINNYLRNDRYKATNYQAELAQLETDKQGIYHQVGIPGGIPSMGIPSIGKDSIGKDIYKRECKRKAPTLDDVKAYIAEKGMTVNAQTFFDYYNVNEWKDVKNWKQKLITWQSHEKDKDKKNGFHNFEERPTEPDTAIDDFNRMMEGE